MDILSMNIAELQLFMKELGQPAYRAVQVFEWLHRRFPRAGCGAFSFGEMYNLPKALREELERRCYITPVSVEKELRAKDGTVKFLLALGGAGGSDETKLCDESTDIEVSTSHNEPANSDIHTTRDVHASRDFHIPSRVLIESVLMEYTHGRSVCISTQAGCRMGCLFCATGQSGLLRNLTAGEMCMQVYTAARDNMLLQHDANHGSSILPLMSRDSVLHGPIAKSHTHVTSESNHQSAINPGGKPPLHNESNIRNIVLMGCGEPLDNFDAVFRFIELITHPKGAGLSQRHITLSTCGLIPEIRALAKRRMQITLAVSLHGPDDATRQTLMPVAKGHPIKDLLAACREYTDMTHRRITFEYALAAGINDSPAQARALAGLLKGLLCHVNLIPVNQISEYTGSQHKQLNPSFTPTNKQQAAIFAEILQKAGIPATVRRTIGAEVNAACGQLRSR